MARNRTSMNVGSLLQALFAHETETDGHLLQRFLDQRDEAAFTLLVKRQCTGKRRWSKSPRNNIRLVLRSSMSARWQWIFVLTASMHLLNAEHKLAKTKAEVMAVYL